MCATSPYLYTPHIESAMDREVGLVPPSSYRPACRLAVVQSGTQDSNINKITCFEIEQLCVATVERKGTLHGPAARIWRRD
jgi:hypothetical protein